MTTATITATVAQTARAAAQFLEDGMRVGMPEPATLSITYYEGPTLIVRTFEEVAEWATYLETETVRDDCVGGEREMLTASADLSDVYGIAVRVTTNRPVEAQA